MKRIIIAIIISTVFALNVNAQDAIKSNKTTSSQDTVKTSKRISFNIGLEEGMPVNYVSKYASFVTGGSVQAEYELVKALDVTFNAGFLYFLAKDGEDGLSFLPVMAGLKYSFIPRFYVSGQLGTSFYIGKDSNKTTYLTYAQGIGFKASKQIDILAKYEGINTQASRTYSFAGLRISYKLNNNK